MQKCVMISYARGSKAYQKKVIISRDVVFDERPKLPAPPEPRVDLSEFVWNGRADTLPKGVTAVGDAS